MSSWHWFKNILIPEHVDKIKERATDLKRSLNDLEIKTYPSQTYFFLGKVPNMTADEFAQALEKGISISERFTWRG